MSFAQAQDSSQSAEENNNNKNSGVFSGSLMSNGNFFIRDAAIGAANTPQYEHQLFGAETWLNLNYSNWGFDFGLRFDLFNNSNLLNPQGSYTAKGIGNWFVKKKVENLGITAGYIYDQIGSGIIFRAFEERPLAIDNALFGIHLTYDLSKNWRAKAFTGQQKQQFDSYAAVIKGASIDGFVTLGKDDAPITCSPGFGVVNRTHDDETIQKIVSSITTYTPQDSIGAKYNTYAFSAYNTLSVGDFSWYVEGAYKTQEDFFDPYAKKLQWTGEITDGKLVSRQGTIVYSSVSYAGHGLGVTLEGKRTENFTFRTNPFVTRNNGAINFLPPMTRQNSYRLTARYQAATQELGEQAIQADVRYKINDQIGANVNFSNITDLNNQLLYRELFTEVTYKKSKKWSAIGGIQLQIYNQRLYEVKPNVPLVRTIVPYAEFLYKFSKTNALRVEAQYMFTRQDYGNWLYLSAEYSIAPHWIFTVLDMYNIVPNTKKLGADAKKIHYPTVGVVYTTGANRFSLSYVKQVEGVVCTGGICRLEPAFSGVRMNVISTF